jgi:hypothetical protein
LTDSNSNFPGYISLKEKQQISCFIHSEIKLRMSLSIAEVEEFNPVARIQRSDIDLEVLDGIRQLGETTEIEPYLREIIADQTHTAHNSSEIADIITDLTINGKATRTAFVNKGKSFPKVTAKQVTHQISRLRGIQGLELIVLAASGDIQDDAKRDLFQTASDAGAQALILDAIDLARLFIAHHKICPKDGYSYQNGQCSKCGRSASVPIDLTIQVFEEPIFRTLRHEDNSAMIKRYRADLLTDPHYPKATIREIIARATNDLKTSRYTSADFEHNRFGDQDAQCVWLFIYQDLYDHQQTNWICRSLWIDPKTPSQYRPSPLDGQEFLGEIEIDWNSNYTSTKSFWSERQHKHEWLSKIDALIPEITNLAQVATSLLEQLAKNQLAESAFTNSMTKVEERVSEIYHKAQDDVFPPLECQDASSSFRNMLSYWHNIFFLFAPWVKSDRSWENTLWLVKDALKNYTKARTEFDFEWRKVR